MSELDLTSLLRDLRWQDLVDILLVTLVASAAYRLIRRTVAVQVAIGLAILLAGSWIANHFGLILTSYLLSAIGAVATIAIVVLFQAEIRRALTRLNPSRWLARAPAKNRRADISAIVAESAFSLAARRKGALIVLPRRDPVFDHVTAGTVVEARLSAPLVEAIFTSTSPLHDGAVVLREDRVSRAGVVLPLATESADPRHGTRHRAALGLARATDALVVCVSEEYGTVTLAHDDTAEGIGDAALLCAALRRLGSGGERPRQLARKSGQSRWAGVVPHLAILAGVVTAWAAFALDRSHAVTRIVPLEIRGLGDQVTIDPPHPTTVAVELRSSRRELELLPSDAVQAYVEIQPSKLGSRVYRVHASAPAGIDIASYVPDSVQIFARPRAAAAKPATARRDGGK